jgi:hypothetical protein
MDASLRNLFSRRSQKHDQLRLKAHPYESTIKQQSPTKGTRPIPGNGPYRLENVALQSQVLAAEPPDVPRSRPDYYSNRPRTAPQSAQFGPHGRTRSGFSTIAPPPSPRYVNPYNPAPAPERVRSVSAFSSPSVRTQKQSAYVDLLDAVARVNPTTRTFIQKRIASGRRDYGEDVADRNIAEFGGDEFPQQDAYSYSDDVGAESQDDPNQVDEWQTRPDSREELDSRDGSTRGLVSRLESDGAGDDTAVLNQRTKYSTSQIYSPANQNPSNSMPPTAANSHAKHGSGNSNYSANGMRGKGRPGRSSSASTNAGPSVIPAPYSNAIMSANLYHMSGGLSRTVPTNEPLREEADSHQPIRRTVESRGTQTTPPPPEPVVASPIVPVRVSSQQDTEDSDSDAYDPPPISRSRSSTHTILPTLPMSPITGGSPAASIQRASLDKELPPPLPGAQASPAPKRHSRGGSASYSIFQPQQSGRNVKAASPATTKASENSGATVRPNDKKQGGRVLEGSSEPTRLEDVVDTTNTVDTEIIKEQLPGMCFSFVTTTSSVGTSLIYSSCCPRTCNSEGTPYQGRTHHSRNPQSRYIPPNTTYHRRRSFAHQALYTRSKWQWSHRNPRI